MVNLEVLKYIVNNAEEWIFALAKQKNINGEASLGVAKVLIGNDGDDVSLSEKQQYHYENCIRPLLENVTCDGVFQDRQSCSSGDIIDDDSLLLSYMEDTFQCQICRYDARKHGI